MVSFAHCTLSCRQFFRPKYAVDWCLLRIYKTRYQVCKALNAHGILVLINISGVTDNKQMKTWIGKPSQKLTLINNTHAS